MVNIKSHPTWVCGLKPHLIGVGLRQPRHTLRGCVDWNHQQRQTLFPFWSHPTWVCGLKLNSPSIGNGAPGSHPTWVCGLKPTGNNHKTHLPSHTLRGCVDWNPLIIKWVFGYFCHTLRGCVDWNRRVERPRFPVSQSHPTWVCGLKPFLCIIPNRVLMSHPTWVCGLKQRTNRRR